MNMQTFAVSEDLRDPQYNCDVNSGTELYAANLVVIY